MVKQIIKYTHLLSEGPPGRDPEVPRTEDVCPIIFIFYHIPLKIVYDIIHLQT